MHLVKLFARSNYASAVKHATNIEPYEVIHYVTQYDVWKHRNGENKLQLMVTIKILLARQMARHT